MTPGGIWVHARDKNTIKHVRKRTMSEVVAQTSYFDAQNVFFGDVQMRLSLLQIARYFTSKVRHTNRMFKARMRCSRVNIVARTKLHELPKALKFLRIDDL